MANINKTRYLGQEKKKNKPRNTRMPPGVITTTEGKVMLREVRPCTEGHMYACLLHTGKKTRFSFCNWKRRTWMRSLRRYE